MGAVSPTERSTVCPGETVAGKLTVVPPIASPLENTRVYDVFQVQDPMFFKRQVLVKAAPGAKMAPSGTVTSATNWALSHVEIGGVPVNVGVGLGGVPVTVAVGVGVWDGVTDVLVTLISTHQGLLASEPIPNKAPLAFLNIQYPR